VKVRDGAVAELEEQIQNLLDKSAGAVAEIDSHIARLDRTFKSRGKINSSDDESETDGAEGSRKMENAEEEHLTRDKAESNRHNGHSSRAEGLGSVSSSKSERLREMFKNDFSSSSGNIADLHPFTKWLRSAAASSHPPRHNNGSKAKRENKTKYSVRGAEGESIVERHGERNGAERVQGAYGSRSGGRQRGSDELAIADLLNLHSAERMNLQSGQGSPQRLGGRSTIEQRITEEVNKSMQNIELELFRKLERKMDLKQESLMQALRVEVNHRVELKASVDTLREQMDDLQEQLEITSKDALDAMSDCRSLRTAAKRDQAGFQRGLEEVHRQLNDLAEHVKLNMHMTKSQDQGREPRNHRRHTDSDSDEVTGSEAIAEMLKTLHARLQGLEARIQTLEEKERKGRSTKSPGLGISESFEILNQCGSWIEGLSSQQEELASDLSALDRTVLGICQDLQVLKKNEEETKKALSLAPKNPKIEIPAAVTPIPKPSAHVDPASVTISTPEPVTGALKSWLEVGEPKKSPDKVGEHLIAARGALTSAAGELERLTGKILNLETSAALDPESSEPEVVARSRSDLMPFTPGLEGIKRRGRGSAAKPLSVAQGSPRSRARQILNSPLKLPLEYSTRKNRAFDSDDPETDEIQRNRSLPNSPLKSLKAGSLGGRSLGSKRLVSEALEGLGGLGVLGEAGGSEPQSPQRESRVDSSDFSPP